MPPGVRALLLLTATLSVGVASAKTLQVGPGRPYARPCLALAAAAAGDTVEIEASGSYQGDTCAWSTDNLTVRGVNGRPRLDITGVAPAQKKGLFTIYAPSATIENLEFAGAAISVADGNNGAGIRHQGLNLTVRGCYFHDNQNGILGSPSAAGEGEVLIESSEFARNGAGDGYSHNMYLGNYARFTLQASYSHDAKVGHLVKVRAKVSRILYNRLTDERGSASYELNLPNAGTAYVIGNVIEQSATTQNPTLLAYGEEGVPAGWDTHLYVINNTFLNNRKSGTFLNNKAATPAVLTNNIFWNGGTVAAAGTVVQTASFESSSQGDPRFVDVAGYDVRLRPDSPCVDKGQLPAAAEQRATLEYTHPVGTAPRSVAGSAVDVGAYEHRPPGPDGGDGGDAGVGGEVDGAGGVPGDAGMSGGGGASSGCTIHRAPAAWSGPTGLLVLLLLTRLVRRAKKNA